MHDDSAHVLTNAPACAWHLLNLRNFLNLSTIGTESIRVGSADVMRHHAARPTDAAQAIQTVGHILNTVDIPLGISQSRQDGKLVSDFTQWVVIRDLTHGRMLIADHDHRLTFVTLDLGVLFAQAQPASIPVSDLPYPASIDATRSLVK